jgi:hypothetical protein
MEELEQWELVVDVEGVAAGDGGPRSRPVVELEQGGATRDGGP